MANMLKLLDIYCANLQKRRALEIQLRMTKDDFDFYNNQKESRTATCINIKPPTTSDIEFKRKDASQ